MTKPKLFPPRTTIKPGNDFYAHINGNWQRHVHVPPHSTSYGVSEEMEEQIAKELQKEMKKSVKEVKNGGQLSNEEEEIGTLALSALQPSYQKESVAFLESLIHKLGCMRDVNDVASTIGDFCRYRVNTLLSITSGPESKHSRKIRISIGIGEMGLPDVSYYKATAPGKMRTLLGYIRLLRTLGEKFNIPKLELLAGFESESANPMKDSFGDDEVLMKGSTLAKKYREIPWDIIFANTLNFSNNESDNTTFIIKSQKWLKYVNKLFRTLTVSQWKIWLSGNIILHALPVLPPPYDDYHFALFGKMLRGQKKKVPELDFALDLCEKWLPVSLGKVFEDCCLDTENVRIARKLADNIMDAAIRRIHVTNWLDSTTKRKAISKVKHVYIGLGVPEVWPHTVEPELVHNNLLKNILKLGESQTETDLNATKHSLAIRSWDDQSFAVNAYYYSEANRLLIPGGILRFPFIDKKLSDGWNYGGIGSVMGHELTHAFDMDGKDFNEHGDEVSWWLPADNRRYYNITQQLVDLFNNSKFKKHPVNGSLTLSENISDLGGVAIALEALETILKNKKCSDEEKKQEYIDFFTSYAVSWRVKEKQARSLQRLIMDRHSPAELRVNLVVSQFQQWYDVFNVTEGDSLFIPPEKRIRIF